MSAIWAPAHAVMAVRHANHRTRHSEWSTRRRSQRRSADFRRDDVVPTHRGERHVITNNAALVFDLRTTSSARRPSRHRFDHKWAGCAVAAQQRCGHPVQRASGNPRRRASITAPVTVASGARLWPKLFYDQPVGDQQHLTLAEAAKRPWRLTASRLPRQRGSHDRGELRRNTDREITSKATSPAATSTSSSAHELQRGLLRLQPAALMPTALVMESQRRYSRRGPRRHHTDQHCRRQNGSTLDLSWPADYTGWLLQVQTNDPESASPPNWTCGLVRKPPTRGNTAGVSQWVGILPSVAALSGVRMCGGLG